MIDLSSLLSMPNKIARYGFRFIRTEKSARSFGCYVQLMGILPSGFSSDVEGVLVMCWQLTYYGPTSVFRFGGIMSGSDH